MKKTVVLAIGFVVGTLGAGLGCINLWHAGEPAYAIEAVGVLSESATLAKAQSGTRTNRYQSHNGPSIDSPTFEV